MLDDLARKWLPSSQTSQLIAVVVAINAGSHFMLYLDGVVDNLLPAAHGFLMQHYKSEEEASRNWELMVSLRMYGLALGCLLSILLSSSWGRKPQVLLGLLLDVIGVAMTAVVIYLPGGLAAAHLGRFINGAGQGICQTAGTVMLSELPPRRCRGTVLATMTVFACMGELMSMLLTLEELLGNAALWHLAMAFPLLLLLPAFAVVAAAPESPRYLLMQDATARRDECIIALHFYQSPQDAKKTLADMLSEKEQSQRSREIEKMDINANSPLLKKSSTGQRLLAASGVADRLWRASFLRPLAVACILQTFVHLDDWLWVSYSTHIFARHGLADSAAQKASLVMCLPQTLLSLGLISVFDKFSRKSLIIVPTLASAAIGAMAIVVISAGHPPPGVGTCLLPFLASLDLCMAGISGESAFAVVPELFLYEDNIAGTAISGIAQSLFGGVLLNCLLTAIDHAGTQRVLVPFVFGNLVYAAFNYGCVPETARKTPQEVAEALERIFARPRRLGLEGAYALPVSSSSSASSSSWMQLLAAGAVRLLVLLALVHLALLVLAPLVIPAAQHFMAPAPH